jgi:glycine/serine hydroxymethyltransferase
VSDEKTEATKKTQHDKISELIKRYTRHKNVKLVHRGNAAIFCALYIAKQLGKEKIIIPDQGGWISFKTYPGMLGLQLLTVKTDDGVIDLDDLAKKAGKNSAFIVTSFAGYFAEQPMKMISEVCRKNGCLLIEDASGAVGDETLCDGNHSDIIVGSFGRWKPINAEYGGFISAAKKEWFDKNNDVFSMTNHYPEYDALLAKLDNAPLRLKEMIAIAERVKQEVVRELPGIEIVHRESRGLNVIAKYKNEKEKQSMIKYCERHRHEYVECPQYIRLEEKAISIELKRERTENTRAAPRQAPLVD